MVLDDSRSPKVFVVDANGTPLLPTHPARSRKLLRAGKAQVISVVPFTIQLSRIVDHPAGSFVVGIDDGASKVGIAAINEVTREVVFSAELSASRTPLLPSAGLVARGHALSLLVKVGRGESVKV